MQGNILRSEIDGSIVIKSYLKGSPAVHLALNEDLVIGAGTAAAYGTVVLDDCNFHECADIKHFDTEKSMTFSPPQGEFTLMNYRISSDFHVPFRVQPFVEELGPNRIDVIIKVSFPIST